MSNTHGFLILGLVMLGGCNSGGQGEPVDAGDSGSAADGDADADADPCARETASRVEQYGIAWTFAETVPHGVFANGDPWVVGPVTLTSLTPEFDGEHHGWQVNPTDIVAQGFDVRVADFDATLVPALPHTVRPGESIVKAVSIEPLADAGCSPCLDTAAVLTVLAAPPPDCGATAFRPPYFGAEKPFYSTDDLRTDLLPSLAPPADAPALADIAEQLRRVQLDHKSGWTGRAMHPKQNMPDYGSSIADRNADAALRLMLDDATAAKRDALVAYVQEGIDLYHMLLGGQTWPANGGHGEGRKLPIAFAAVLLDDAAIRDAVRNAGRDAFGENGGMYASDTAGTVLWGQEDNSEENYWRNIVFDTGSRTIRDPYHWIDGGHRPGDSYQFCCTTMAYKATATAAILMPEIRALWNHDAFFAYVERWVADGAWSQPDPCAPPDGVCSGGDHPGLACTSAVELQVCTGTGAFCDLTASWDAGYGKTYGPDGSGGCIPDTDPSDGIGRFPERHGTNADTGYYGSALADAMWTSYVEPTL